MRIDAKNMHFNMLNEAIKKTPDKEIVIDNCCGQRYIGAGAGDKHIVINGTAGNALGAYLDGASIVVNGSGQDALGDTMNDGKILIQGDVSDALGYAMRGGKIYVKKNAGYRAGVHLKQYEEKIPVIIIGGVCQSFLGEYQAGGIIIVLNINNEKEITGNFTATGMHGGKIYLRCDEKPQDLPKQVCCRPADSQDIKEIYEHIDEFCQDFKLQTEEIINDRFYVLYPDEKNPYTKLYVSN